MHGSDEEPRPQSSDRWRIQAEQMPPFRKVIETTCQSSVYVCRAGCILHLVRLIFLDWRFPVPSPSPAISRQPLQSSLRDFSSAHPNPGLRPGLISAVPTGLVPIFPPSQQFERTNLDKTEVQQSPFDKLRAGSTGLDFFFRSRAELGGSVRLKRPMRLKGFLSRIYEVYLCSLASHMLI
jgi:hypothetical protein